jgi:hypothetical protein
MRWAKGFFGRVISALLRFAHVLLKGIGMHKMANMLTLNLFNMPLRGFVRFGQMSTPRNKALIRMCNDRFGGILFLFPIPIFGLFLWPNFWRFLCAGNPAKKAAKNKGGK